MTAGETLRKALVVDGDKATTALIRSLLLKNLVRRMAVSKVTIALLLHVHENLLRVVLV